MGNQTIQWRKEGPTMQWRNEGPTIQWRKEGPTIQWRKEGPTIQWRNEKKDKRTSKTLHRKLKVEQHEPQPLKTTCGTRRVTLVINSVIRHACGKVYWWPIIFFPVSLSKWFSFSNFIFSDVISKSQWFFHRRFQNKINIDISLQIYGHQKHCNLHIFKLVICISILTPFTQFLPELHV